MTSPKTNKTQGPSHGGENLRTVFVRAYDPAKAVTDDQQIRDMILLSGGKIEKVRPFKDGTYQYQVKIPPDHYDALQEGWPLFEARPDKPYRGPSIIQRLPKPRPALIS